MGWRASLIYQFGWRAFSFSLAGYLGTCLCALFVVIDASTVSLQRSGIAREASHASHFGTPQLVGAVLASAVIALIFLPLQTNLVRKLKGQWSKSWLTRRALLFQRNRLAQLQNKQQRLMEHQANIQSSKDMNRSIEDVRTRRDDGRISREDEEIGKELADLTKRLSRLRTDSKS